MPSVRITSIVLIGACQAYLLSLPLFGPLMNLSGDSVDTYSTTFLVTHLAGVLLGGWMVDRIERRVLTAKIASIFLILAVFAFYFGYYILAAIIQGIFLGIAILIWGSILARSVKPWDRARTFAIGATLGNIFLLLIQYTGSNVVILAALPLLPVFLLPDIKFQVEEAVGINKMTFHFALPVMIFYTLGGFMYAVMEPAFRESGISTHVLFYIVVILIAGYLYDSFGRKFTSILGLVLLALSFTVFNKNMLVSAYLIQSSYGFLDVFSMIIWADLSLHGAEGKHYSIGIFAIVSSLLIGYKVVLWYHLNPFDFQSIALLLLLFAAISIGIVKEPMLSVEEYTKKASKLGDMK